MSFLDMDSTPSSTRTLDTDNQTSQPTQLSNTNTNGSLNRRHPTTGPPLPQPPSSVVSYKECLKNHAASTGGHAVDGCGEFMPSSSSNPTEPRSLTCAACGCHRSFHRRDTQEYPNFISFYHSAAAPPLLPPLSYRGLSLSTSHSLSPSQSPISSPSPPPLSHLFPPSSHHHHSSAPHMLYAIGNAYSDEQHHRRSLNSSMVAKAENPNGKKRHRTKFSHEQKQKMHSFSEKLGWKIQKGDEGLVQQFCNDIGVSKGVFKVWMHNNKNTFKKRFSEMGNAHSDDKTNGDVNGNGDARGGFDSDINSPHNTDDINRNGGSSVNLHVSGNGSSSS